MCTFDLLQTVSLMTLHHRYSSLQCCDRYVDDDTTLLILLR